MSAPLKAASSPWFTGEFPALHAQMEAHQERMRTWCELVSHEKGAHEFHLVLGGGYGRGEGGVSVENGEPGFHNDLDYFLFVDNRRFASRLYRQIREIEAIESKTLNVDVEIQPLPLSNIQDQAHTLMMTDLANGHDTVFGDISEPLSVIPRNDYSHIPADEITRLLWNRGSGIYFSKQILMQKKSGGQLDEATLRFVIRNLQKVHLALGDAFLLDKGCYHVKVANRVSLIEAGDTTHARYAEAAAFKERPTFPSETPSRSELLEDVDATARVWLEGFLDHESKRLGASFSDASAYVNYSGKLYPESLAIKNLMLRSRDQLKHREGLPDPTDYPRAALQRALCALLFDEPDFIQTLGWPADIYDDSFKDTYTAWWSRYS